jgi:hypothetical protein
MVMRDNEHHVPAQCGNCRYFRNDAAYVERLFAGLTSLSSGYGSFRSNDGICLRHDRYLRAEAHCDEFTPVELSSGLPGRKHQRP